MGVSRVVEIDAAGAPIRLILSDSTCGAPPRRGQNITSCWFYCKVVQYAAAITHADLCNEAI
jgi:hypothetical protein